MLAQVFVPAGGFGVAHAPQECSLWPDLRVALVAFAAMLLALLAWAGRRWAAPACRKTAADEWQDNSVREVGCWFGDPDDRDCVSATGWPCGGGLLLSLDGGQGRTLSCSWEDWDRLVLAGRRLRDGIDADAGGEDAAAGRGTHP